MQDRKNITITALALFLLIIGGTVFLYQAKPIIKDGSRFSIFRVMYNHDNISEDVSEKINLRKVESIINSYQCKRLAHSFAPYQHDKVIIEIDGISDSRPIHLLLGEINVIYESADIGGFEIQHSDKLLLDILELIERKPNEH